MGKRGRARHRAWVPPDPDVPEIVPEIVRADSLFAVHIKNCATHDMLYGTGDIPQLLTFYREGRPLCRVMCRVPNRDEGLEAAQLGRAYWSADMIVMVSDAHYVDERWWKEKGRKPDPHELQHLCDNDGACDIGLTTDVLAINAMTAGDLHATLVSLPYHINKRVRQVHWQSEVQCASEDERIAVSEGVERMSLGGDIYNAFRAILALTPMYERMKEEAAEAGLTYGEWAARKLGDPGYTQATDEEFRFQMDMAGMNFLIAAGYQVMWAHHDDEYNARVTAWLHGAGFEGDGNVLRSNGLGSPAITMLGQRWREEGEQRWNQTRQEELAVAARNRAARGE